MTRRVSRLRVWLAALVLASALVPVVHAQSGIPAFDSPVVDTTGTLDAATRQQLEQQALALQQRKGSQLQVLMIPSTQPEDIEAYAVRAFELFKLGRKGVDDGVLLVVARDDRKVRIEVGYGLEGAIPDITAGRVIQEYLAPRFRQGDYAAGVVDATAQLVRLVDGEPLPEPVASNATSSGTAIDIVLALVAAFIVASFLGSMLGGSGLPAGVVVLVCGGSGGGVAWWMTSSLFAAILGAVFGILIGRVVSRGGGRNSSGWSSGGGWSSSGGSSSGGGWSGGGGSSGGGGASGSW